MKIKVCGMRDGENIRQVAGLGVDYIGLDFRSESPRFVNMIPTHAGIIPDKVATAYEDELSVCGPSSAGQRKRPLLVGVFADEMPQNIITRVVNFGLDVVQLNGSESPTLIRNLRATVDPDLRPGLQIWKTICLPSSDDGSAGLETIATYKQYEACVDAFLLDSDSPHDVNNRCIFDHCDVLNSYDGERPFILSGGIGPDDAARIRTFDNPKCMAVDLNRCFETAPGMKDIDRLRTFIAQLTAD